MSRRVPIVLLVAVLSMAAGRGSTAASGPSATTAAAAEQGVQNRVRGLLADSNVFWSQYFVSLGGHYPAPVLNFFDGKIAGVCDVQQAQTGPFYCAQPQTIYLDESFLQQALMHTGNDPAALAYVIGHQVAHHVQDLVGTTAAVNEARLRSSPALSMRTWMTAELQADCYAALWLQTLARRGQIHLTDPSALLDAIAAVSREWQGRVHSGQMMPDPVLSYGTAAQRLDWFRRGLTGKGFPDCDTFGAESAGKL